MLAVLYVILLPWLAMCAIWCGVEIWNDTLQIRALRERAAKREADKARIVSGEGLR